MRSIFGKTFSMPEEKAGGTGRYRYRLLLGTVGPGEHYDFEIVLHKRDKKGLKDFSKEEAEEALKKVGSYLMFRADFKTLKEDF